MERDPRVAIVGMDFAGHASLLLDPCARAGCASRVSQVRGAWACDVAAELASAIHDAACGAVGREAFCEAMAGIVKSPLGDEIDDDLRDELQTTWPSVFADPDSLNIFGRVACAVQYACRYTQELPT